MIVSLTQLLPTRSPRPAQAALPDTFCTHHRETWYALEDARSGALLCETGPVCETGLERPVVRLFSTFVDAYCERARWCCQQFAEMPIPPDPQTAVRIVPLTPQRAREVRGWALGIPNARCAPQAAEQTGAWTESEAAALAYEAPKITFWACCKQQWQRHWLTLAAVAVGAWAFAALVMSLGAQP